MLTKCMLCVFACSLVLTAGAALASETQIEPYLAVGFGSQGLDWSIAPATHIPNVLSELTWRDMSTLELTVGATAIRDDGLYARTFLSTGSIRDGEVQDSDYAGNNRTQEFSRSLSSADGDLSAFSLGVGRLVKNDPAKMQVAALVGYSRHSLDLEVKDMVQVVSAYGFGVPVGYRVPGLVATYDVEFAGPWLGLDLRLKQTEKLAYLASLEYHWADYEGIGDWLKRSDLAHPSFTHDGDATGTLVSVGAKYVLNEHTSLRGKLAFENWSADSGTYRRFAASGSTTTAAFNGANFDSFVFALDATYLW